MTTMPVSLILIGFHSEIQKTLQEWNELGAINLLGIWDPYSNAFPSYEKQTPHTDQSVDLILVTNKKKEYVDKIADFQQNHTLVIDLNTFWILELIITKTLALQELSENEQLFQTISKYSHEGIQFVDAEGIVQYVNPSFSRITNVFPEERIGKSIFDVSPNGALVQVLKKKAPVIGWKSTSQGSNVETISNAAPIFVEGELRGAVTTFQDITEIKHLSMQLQERDQEISSLYDHLSHVHIPHYSFQDIIGESNIIQRTIEVAKKAARTRSTVLITGESGTGKELFAHAIHASSAFHQKPFVAVNCAAIPATLLESELFGFEKGAFTHATKQKIGKVELANEGTLFLDEIGDMSPPLQAKLLRVLQSKEFERVGGLQTIKVNVRVIAATNRQLQNLVEEGKFREDLYYRLHVIRLETPPLRERIQDLPFLVQVLMDRISRRIGLSPMTLTNKGTGLLTDYHWPGNIRELENFLERLMNESTSSVIPDSLVRLHMSKLLGTSTPFKGERQVILSSSDILPLRVIERDQISKALAHFGTSLEGKKQAANCLGISIATLYNKIREYRLNDGWPNP
ncbi:sigma-54 interaction domain-containing protein [Brevibacillus choshinensis]|uniref:sigma-54 interaction domain-containing protein n=1 Tax=Brevibacillus choshinensis TaxID=54911 RepID=UPI002E1B4979|nr:sigma 54-interacting transcriptional regulator [Brevibacillus choshinensis]MED4583160.1 sigma 54-interacting transcriptional regulator [Brevibacillus choshinensis]MED4753079.1 sigma 54-interacting transcriptional regulator [Brevibacillus choshinensis]